MVNKVLFPAGAAVATAFWAYHGKLGPLPKINKLLGYGGAAVFAIIAFYEYEKSKQGGGKAPFEPPRLPLAAARYTHNPAIPAREPLGSFTGPGMDARNVPSSSVWQFPHNVRNLHSRNPG